MSAFQSTMSTGYATEKSALVVGWDYGSLVLLFVFQAIMYSASDSQMSQAANIIGALWLMATLLLAAFQNIMRDPNTIWTALCWFRIAGGVFLGFGGLAPALANEETRMTMASLMAFTPTDQLKVMMVETFGMAATLYAASAFIGVRFRARQEIRGPRHTLTYAVWFLLIGAVLRYGVAIPVSFGNSDIVAGIILSLANIYYVGLVLLTIHSVETKRYHGLLIALILVDLFFSVLTFSKRQVILVILFPALAYISKSFSVRKLAVISVSIMIIFPLTQGVVEYGRSQLSWVSGSAVQGSLSQRMEVLGYYLDGDSIDTINQDRQSSLLRLSYVNADVFVVNQYDDGYPGASYRNIFYVFIPRAIWPDKPIMSDIGIHLYQLMTGLTGSSFGVTLWAEAYWNFGWAGVPVVSILIALVLSIFSKVSLRVMRHGDWLFMPIVILGLTVGTRVDGFLVSDIIGPATIALAIAVFLTFLRNISWRNA